MIVGENLLWAQVIVLSPFLLDFLCRRSSVVMSAIQQVKI